MHAVPELEAAVWFEAWFEKSMSLALAYGTSLTYVGKIHEHFTCVQASLP